LSPRHFAPSFPAPRLRTVIPSSMPAGIRIDTRCSVCVRPWPRQSRHGLELTWPSPAHFGHGRATWIGPSLEATWPCPRHVSHVTERLPGSMRNPLHRAHTASFGSWILLSTPAGGGFRGVSHLVSQLLPRPRAGGAAG